MLSPARAEKIAFVTAAEVGATSAPAAAEQGAARRLDIGETGENVPRREDRVSVYGMGHVCRTVMEVVVGSKIPHQVRMEKRARGRKIRKIHARCSQVVGQTRPGALQYVISPLDQGRDPELNLAARGGKRAPAVRQL